MVVPREGGDAHDEKGLARVRESLANWRRWERTGQNDDHHAERLEVLHTIADLLIAKLKKSDIIAEKVAGIEASLEQDDKTRDFEVSIMVSKAEAKKIGKADAIVMESLRKHLKTLFPMLEIKGKILVSEGNHYFMINCFIQEDAEDLKKPPSAKPIREAHQEVRNAAGAALTDEQRLNAVKASLFEWHTFSEENKRAMAMTFLYLLRKFLKQRLPWIAFQHDIPTPGMIGGCHDDREDMDFSVTVDIRTQKTNRPQDYGSLLEKAFADFMAEQFKGMDNILSLRVASRMRTDFSNHPPEVQRAKAGIDEESFVLHINIPKEEP